jgi:hypothetical protein
VHDKFKLTAPNYGLFKAYVETTIVAVTGKTYVIRSNGNARRIILWYKLSLEEEGVLEYDVQPC